MRSFKIVALGAFALFASSAAQLRAQIIIGKVVENDALRRPIPDGTVRLLDAGGGELNYVVRTNAAGTFTMPRVPAGSYRLQFRRIGYDPIMGSLFSVDENETVIQNLVALPLTLRLANVRTTTRAGVEHGRDGMDTRCKSERAQCMFRGDIEKHNLSYLPDVFSNLKDIRVMASGEIMSLKGNRCLIFMVNRLPVRYYVGFRPDSELSLTLNDLIPTAHDLMGIEVYPSFQDVPTVFKMQAWPTPKLEARQVSSVTNTLPGLFARNDPCGLINIWTSAAW
jgi:hypothetical protein